jgi:RAD50-interacting protein 1
MIQFFLEFWAEINRRASLRARVDKHPSLPQTKGKADAYTPDNTIFQELVLQYRKLVDRAENMIVQHVCGEIESGLRAHFSSCAFSFFARYPLTS